MNHEEIRPTASLLEEIEDHVLDETAAGTGTTVTYPIASWYLGNQGYVCTITLECQKSCQ